MIEQFYGQEFTLSDGKTAIMDKRDAQELSHKSDELKTAELSNLKKIIESAMFSHEANNVTHRKFSDFRYYSLTVKFKDQSFDILLNVGKSKYDSKYHIYDITKNRRAANQSPTGLSRSVDNAMKNSSSTDSIPDSSENVNPSDEKIRGQQRIETPGASEVLSDLFRDNPNLNGYADQRKELKSYQELLRSVKVNEQRIAEIDAEIKSLKSQKAQGGKGTRMAQLYEMRKTAEDRVKYNPSGHIRGVFTELKNSCYKYFKSDKDKYRTAEECGLIRKLCSESFSDHKTCKAYKEREDCDYQASHKSLEPIIVGYGKTDGQSIY